MISCSPSACVYIGDDMRDIEAAKAANMFSIAASYGFIKNKNTIKEWGSDLIINSPLDLKKLIL
jgi:phosphoglycolate phosphatase-like HAD superfamily hydrolase